MIDNIDDLILDVTKRMKKCVENFQSSISKIHVGRISSDILDDIRVEYYGSMVPLFQLTSITIENANTLIVTVFDHKMIKIIEKAILNSKIDVVSVSFKNIIRIRLPELTKERRVKLVKTVRIEAEQGKISIRNIRRTANDTIKNLLKNKKINEDKEYYLYNQVQDLTNVWIKKIDIILIKKESILITT